MFRTCSLHTGQQVEQNWAGYAAYCSYVGQIAVTMGIPRTMDNIPQLKRIDNALMVFGQFLRAYYREASKSAQLTRSKRVAGRQTTTLTHYGRKSGKPYEVTIWFVLEGDKVYLGTANVNRQWVRNVQKTPNVRLSIGGETFDGTAHFFAERAECETCYGGDSTEVLDHRPLIALGQILTAIGVMRDKSGEFEVTLAE